MSSPSPQSADAILDESFLEVRAKLLEVAAVLDRIDRASQDAHSLSDSSMDQLNKLAAGMNICLTEGPDRAARLQQLFSRSFSDSWRQEMSL